MTNEVDRYSELKTRLEKRNQEKSIAEGRLGVLKNNLRELLSLAIKKKWVTSDEKKPNTSVKRLVAKKRKESERLAARADSLLDAIESDCNAD